MKFFFRMVLLAWMLVFCSGCGLREEGGKAGGGGGQEAAGETADGVWQQVDTAMGTVVQQTVYGSGEDENIGEKWLCYNSRKTSRTQSIFAQSSGKN